MNATAKDAPSSEVQAGAGQGPAAQANAGQRNDAQAKSAPGKRASGKADNKGSAKSARSRALGLRFGRRKDREAAPSAAEVAAMRLILHPVVSEKSTLVGEKNNQVVFRIAGEATKDQVRAAIEAFFKVNVTAVNVVNTKGKTRRTGRTVGRRQDTRKAYVTLAQGQEINFVESR